MFKSNYECMVLSTSAVNESFQGSPGLTHKLQPESDNFSTKIGQASSPKLHTGLTCSTQ